MNLPADLLTIREYLAYDPATGVFTWLKARNNHRWVAQIKANGRVRHIGSFRDEVEAARAYDAAAQRLHGEFANLNFPLARAA